MADDDLILTLDATLAQRLRACAEAAGESVEAYALDILGRAVEPPGVEDTEARWDGAPARVPSGNGIGEDDDEAYADELDRICQETLRTGGVPWEQVEARLRNLGKPR
jgi:plasmid stability protein